MTGREFEKLAERYKAGKCTPEEIAFVERWVEFNEKADGRKIAFENEAEAAATEADIWKKIAETAGISTNEERRRNRWRLITGLAASFLLAGGLSFFLFGKREKGAEIAIAGLETYNTSVNRQRILLPDSSVVTLAEGSSLVTSEEYGQKNRIVRLEGEAFFEIKRNPARPFLLYSGGLVTEVLGTSFYVKPNQSGKTIEVSVVTGKVSVYSSEKNRSLRQGGVVITPNQKIVYNTRLKTLRQDIVDDPQLVVAENEPKPAFKFDETPVGEVLSELRNAYGMDIVVNNVRLNSCRFTGNLDGFDLFRQLSYICDVIDAKYEVRDATIFITGNGCNNTL